MPHKECRTCDFCLQKKDNYFCVYDIKRVKSVNSFDTCKNWRLWTHQNPLKGKAKN